jgi:hypothetical protein
MSKAFVLGRPFQPNHGQTLAKRIKTRPSFQLKIWAYVYNMHFLHPHKTAYLKVENSAQTFLGSLPLAFALS